MSYARRTDASLTAIVKAFRQLGWRVYVCNDSLCDLVIQKGHTRTELIEVKTPNGTFTDMQKRRRADGWQIRTVRSLDDVG